MDDSLGRPMVGVDLSMTCCFGVFPDGSADPAAVFESLEDALDWAVQKYGEGFSIRHVPVAEVAEGERRKAASN